MAWKECNTKKSHTCQRCGANIFTGNRAWYNWRGRSIPPQWKCIPCHTGGGEARPASEPTGKPGEITEEQWMWRGKVADFNLRLSKITSWQEAPSWVDGLRSIEQAMSRVNSPSPRVLEAVEAARETYGPMVASLAAGCVRRRQRVRRLDDGDELDIERWLAGDDKPWEAMLRRRTGGRVVHLGVNICLSASHDIQTTTARGAAAIALSEALICRGYSVALDAVFFADRLLKVGGADVPGCFVVEVKASDEGLDSLAAATMLADAAWERVVVFTAVANAAGPTVNHGLGGVWDKTPAGWDGPFLGSHLETEADVQAWLAAELAKYL